MMLTCTPPGHDASCDAAALADLTLLPGLRSGCLPPSDPASLGRGEEAADAPPSLDRGEEASDDDALAAAPLGLALGACDDATLDGSAALGSLVFVGEVFLVTGAAAAGGAESAACCRDRFAMTALPPRRGSTRSFRGDTAALPPRRGGSKADARGDDFGEDCDEGRDEELGEACGDGRVVEHAGDDCNEELRVDVRLLTTSL